MVWCNIRARKLLAFWMLDFLLFFKMIKSFFFFFFGMTIWVLPLMSTFCCLFSVERGYLLWRGLWKNKQLSSTAVHVTISMLSNNMIPSILVPLHLCIYISKHHLKVLLWPFTFCLLQLIIKSINQFYLWWVMLDTHTWISGADFTNITLSDYN